MFQALRYSNFRWFWLNGAAQALGQGMQFLTIGILVLDFTGSSYKLGLVIFAYGLPNVIFSLLGGIIADRVDRIRLLITTRVAIAALILVLAFLKLADLLELWHIFCRRSPIGVRPSNQYARQNGAGRRLCAAKRHDERGGVALHNEPIRADNRTGARWGNHRTGWHAHSTFRQRRALGSGHHILGNDQEDTAKSRDASGNDTQGHPSGAALRYLNSGALHSDWPGVRIHVLWHVVPASAASVH